MNAELTPTGIPAVGAVRWGSHFCQLYDTPNDMADVLVPYFKVGLERNELCHWVTSDHLGVEDAKSALRAAFPMLDQAVKQGRITIMDRRDWYTRDTGFNPAAVVDGWLAHEEEARSLGYSGYRLTGDTLWLEDHQWDAFTGYEKLVNEAFGSRRMIALCTYCMGKCGASEVLDVVSNHAFAVARRRGDWQVVESPSIKLAKEELAELNATLADRIKEATEELQQLVQHKDALLQEVHHRVKNNLQIVANLLTMRSRGIPNDAQRILAETAERVHAISAVHEALYQDVYEQVDLLGRIDTIGDRLAKTYMAEDRVSVRVEGDQLALPLNMAVPFALLATELLSNAFKHAFPEGRRGAINVLVRELPQGGFELLVADDGVGVALAGSKSRGSGLHIASTLAKQLGGNLSISSGKNGGTDARLTVIRS
jgi:two-component system, sensor histidine kinase PdtaS